VKQRRTTGTKENVDEDDDEEDGDEEKEEKEEEKQQWLMEYSNPRRQKFKRRCAC
jgi:hypothetical protein